jgi:hypothetical protein
MLANKFLSQLTALKNSSINSVDLIEWTPYWHEADLRTKIMVLCMRFISQVTEVMCQTAPQSQNYTALFQKETTTVYE